MTLGKLLNLPQCLKSLAVKQVTTSLHNRNVVKLIFINDCEALRKYKEKAKQIICTDKGYNPFLLSPSIYFHALL